MEDGEARFARRLGAQFGILKWWTIKDMHTPWEWALQMIADRIEPLGDRRADLREAAGIAQLAQCIVTGVLPEDLAENCKNYLEVHQPPEEKILMPHEAQAIKGQSK